MSKLIFILPILILFFGREKVVNSGNPPIYSKYPTKLNNEWKYNTIFIFEYYDSTGNIDSSSIIDFGNTICKIIIINDSINNFNKLILFEEYYVATPYNVHKTWYVNADSDLYAVTYSNPGASQIIIPKQNLNGFESFI